MKFSAAFLNLVGGAPVAVGVAPNILYPYDSASLASGYYAIRYVNPAVARNLSFSVQSDPYECPFPPTMTDIHSTFPGCTPQGTSATNQNGVNFPCLSSANATCSKCFAGYALVGTECKYNPCADTEFYLNFTCVKADVSCLTFDKFSGACLSCQNSNYTLVNGTCKVNACPSGQTARNNTCVNNFCKDFVLITGVCTNCLNNAFELINGACAPVSCLASNLYFSFLAQSCISYPYECTSINFITEKCLACRAPFTLNASTNKCELICVAPQVKWMEQCVNMP